MEILQVSALTTVQDTGRQGVRCYGVGAGGAMDTFSVRLGNLMLGNAEDAAVLEISMPPFRVRFEQSTAICLTGADFGARLDGQPFSPGWAWPVEGGQVLELTRPVCAARAYLCVAGGVDVPVVLNGRGTHLRGGFGGFEGRQLRKGDRLMAEQPRRMLRRRYGVQLAELAMLPRPHRPTVTRVRAMPAGEYERFTLKAREAFWSSEWQLSTQSNRMGLRLMHADARLLLEAPLEMQSHGIMPGVVQVPPGGTPIVLMADTNVQGGYPKIAAVISADLWRVAQIPLGARLTFERVDRGTAVAALRAQEQWLESVRQRVDTWVLD